MSNPSPATLLQLQSDALLEAVARQTFGFFWEGAEPASFLARDRSTMSADPPGDLVAVGWLPPAWEPAGTRVLHREGDDAEVEVYSATGDRQTVHTVREGKSWKVELPVR